MGLPGLRHLCLWRDQDRLANAGVRSGSGKFILQLGTGGDLGTVTFTRSFRPAGEKVTIAPDGQH
jgi:hypothetical protein